MNRLNGVTETYPMELASHQGTLYMVGWSNNALYRLTPTSTTSYTYNPSGPTSTRPHAVTRAGTKTYSYDANGNMLMGDGRVMTYDYENRLSTVRKMSFPPVSPSVIPARLKRESIFDVVGKIWNLPNTALGLVVGGAGYVVGKVGYALGWYSGNPSIQFGHNGIQFLDNPFIAEGGALTLGNAISYSEGIKPGNTGAYYDKSVPYGLHEEAHTYQSQVLGPAFIPTYLSNGLPSRHHPFEHAAQQWAKGEGHWWPW